MAGVSSRSARTFWICIAASLVLHALVLSGLSGAPVTPDPEASVLSAELVNVEPPPPLPKPKPPPKVSPTPTRVPARAAPRPAPVPRPVQADPAPVTVAAAPPEDAAATGGAEAAEQAAAESAPEVESAPAATPPEPALAGAEPQPATPQTGSITYDLFYGSDKFSIGRSVQTWSMTDTTYRLTSFSETTGLVGLFKPYQYAYISVGRIDAAGLHPEVFSVRRGREGERQSMAHFDWKSHELTFGPMASPRKAPLQPGTHDLLSFIYQLARTPLVPGRVTLVITTGTKLDTYRLDVGREEILQLPFGSLRAIPIRQVRSPGEESLEIWLAPEHQFLPVRIRFLDREGKPSVDQLANRITVDGP